MSYDKTSLYENIENNLIEMANLSPKRTGLKVVIWSEQNGDKRNKPDGEPRFKIMGKDYEISYSLEENPRELARSGKIKQSDRKDIQDAIEYVVRNLDLFIKHFTTSAFEFDDDDLKEKLRKRGDYI